MTITPYMLEAGVAAMARIKAKPCEDSAVVTTVFNAMLHAEAYEKKVRDRTATKPVYVHQDFPSWRYGPNGESKLCNSETDVPAGWTDNPIAILALAAVLEATIEKRKPGRPPKAQPSA